MHCWRLAISESRKRNRIQINSRNRPAVVFASRLTGNGIQVNQRRRFVGKVRIKAVKKPVERLFFLALL